MHSVPIKPELYQRVEKIAEWNNQEAADFTEDALLEYLDKLEAEILQREASAYKQMFPQLLLEYEGKYVAIHQGKVIDSDTDLIKLHNRVYLTVPDLPVFFKKVTTEPERDIVVRSPRLERIP